MIESILDTVAAVARTAFGTLTINTLAPPPVFVRGVFRDPVMEALRPLPPHTWSLSSDAGDLTLSPPADADGVTSLLLDLSADPASEWELAWSPDLESGSLPASKEIWIDLDQVDERGALTRDAWVTRVEPIEKRRLVRLVAWSSPWKAERGGFAQGVANMGSTGRILASQFPRMIQAWSKRDAPMVIEVDHDWMWTYIEFVHFDMVSGLTAVLSPGLVVWAKDEDGNIVGGGASISDGRDSSMSAGLIYVLQQRVEAEADDVDFTFTTPANTVLDMDEAFPLKRMRQGAPTETDIRRFMLLPEKWHTFGMQGFLVEAMERADEGRRDWHHEPVQNEFDIDEPPFSIRTAATFVGGARLRFHLDDTVLVDAARRPIVFPARKNLVSALDHLMRVQAPMLDMPHVSAHPLDEDGNYLPAETFVYDEKHENRPEESEKVRYFTRAFEHEGVFHDLRRERVRGTERSTRAIGARAAVANDHPRADYSQGGLVIPGSTSFLGSGLYMVHLFDTPIDQWGYHQVGMHLHHLVVHASVFVEAVESSNTRGVEAVLLNLDAAAKAWSPGHPATDASLERKAYAMVPEKGLAEKAPIVLVRHFFSHRRKESLGPFRILIRDGEFAYFSTRERTMQLETRDAAASGDKLTDPDGSSGKGFVMAHEFGHACSLPDEYLEPIDRRANMGIPGVHQVSGNGGPARPFHLDARSRMQANRLPRLRHFYPHLFALNHDAALRAGLGSVRFALEHGDFSGPAPSTVRPLRYTLHSVPGANAITPDPWAPVARRTVSRGRVELLLYRLGADESTFGSLLAGDGTLELARPVDGILLVRTNYAMRARPRLEATEAAQAARKLLSALGLIGSGPPTHAPLLEGPTSKPLGRVAMVYQPCFALDATTPSPSVEVELQGAGGALAVHWSRGSLNTSSVKLLPEEVGFCLIRFALGLLPLPRESDIYVEPLNAPLTLDELASTGIAAVVDSMLGSVGGEPRTWKEAAS